MPNPSVFALLKLFLTALALLVFGPAPVLAEEIAASYTNGTEVPVTANGYTAAGHSVAFTLNYAPSPGTQLKVIENTGLGFISGTFLNLTQGKTVELTYQGATYPFVANYYGGTGNDLVLVWKATRLYAWGYNINGQLGNNKTTNSNVPVAVSTSGVLAGKTVVAVSAGISHSLALCSDGTVASWGSNFFGQLGNNSVKKNISEPVAVTNSGVLEGKRVVAVSAGGYFSAALCSDGTVATWGSNGEDQLGTESTAGSSVPVAVNTSGALAGKTVVAISAGQRHCLALCSDGKVVSWGDNRSGQLGSSLFPGRIPRSLEASGELVGKKVVSTSAGESHSLAICSDGTAIVWGDNTFKLIRNNFESYYVLPQRIIMSDALSGKTVVNVYGGGGALSCALFRWHLDGLGQKSVRPVRKQKHNRFLLPCGSINGTTFCG